MALKDSYSGTNVNANGAGTTWFAMEFKANSSYNIQTIRLKLYRSGNPGNITVSLRAKGLSDDYPTGSDLISAVRSGNGFSTDSAGSFISFSPSSLYSLSSGSKYEIVIRSQSNYTMVRGGTGYADGGVSTSSNGTSWSSYTPTLDFFFETYDTTYLEGDAGGSTALSGVLTSTNIPRKINLIPFTYSSDTTYMMEFGNEYIRFYYGDSVLLDSNSEVVWISTPYQTADLYALQFEQVGDVMRITHTAYQPRILRRTSATAFLLEVIPFEDGPFLTRHDIVSDDGITLSSSISGALNGSVSYELGPVTGFSDTNGFGTNKIQDDWWDGVANHALGTADDYCGGGTISGGATKQAWITYTIDLSEVVTFSSIELTYICTSHNQSESPNLYDDVTNTQRALSVWSETSPGVFAWVDVITRNTPDSSFPATHHVTGNPAIIATNAHTTTITTTPITNVSKVRILLYTTTNTHDVACALFNVTMAGVDTRTTTITSSANFFTSGMVGSLLYLVHPRTQTTSSSTTNSLTPNIVVCDPISVKGEFRFTTSGSWTGTVKLQRRENSILTADWEDFRVYTSGDPPDLNVNQPFIEDNYNVEYRAIVTLTDGKITATITVTESTQTSIVRIDSVINATTATATLITPMASSAPTKRWAAGAWSSDRGYPMSCCFIEERCCYLGLSLQESGAKLLKVWLSASGDYDSFAAGVDAADSFELTIPTTEAPAWIDAMDNLTIATYKGTWFIRSNKIDSPLVPVPSPIVRKQSGYMCNPIRPIDGGKAMVYVSGRQVRELGYDTDSKEFDTDLTIIAEHFTESPIIGLSIQHNPQQIIWFWHEDETASALAYEKEQNCFGWTHIDVGGKVQSICVTPGSGADDIWFAVERTVNSSGVVYIEKIKPQFIDDSTLIGDLYFVDCGITYNDVATNTISGLDHLEGETVVALCSGVVDNSTDPVTNLPDGTVYTGLTVTGGIVTLPTDITVTKAQIGLTYNYTCEPERIVTQSPRGTTLGSTITFNKFTISFLNTMKAKAGAISTDLRDFDWSDPKFINNSEVTGLFSGDIDGIRDGTYNSEAPIIIGGNDPLPCTIRALIPRLEVTGS